MIKDFSNEDKILLKKALEICQSTTLASLPCEADASEITFSESFNTRMDKLIKLRKKSYYPLIRTAGRRLAFTIIFIFIIISTTILTTKAVAEPLIKFIVEYIGNGFSELKPDPAFNTNSSNQPKNTTYELTYLPDGYRKDYALSTMSGHSVTYTNTYGKELLFNLYNNETDFLLNTDNGTPRLVLINDMYGLYTHYNNTDTIVFSDGTYLFHITGQVGVQELVRCAESIAPKN